jgi:hypothetical protein
MFTLLLASEAGGIWQRSALEVAVNQCSFGEDMFRENAIMTLSVLQTQARND